MMSPRAWRRRGDGRSLEERRAGAAVVLSVACSVVLLRPSAGDAVAAAREPAPLSPACGCDPPQQRGELELHCGGSQGGNAGMAGGQVPREVGGHIVRLAVVLKHRAVLPRRA